MGMMLEPIQNIVVINEMNPYFIDPEITCSTKEESDKNYKKIARNITKETIIEK